MFNFLGQSKAQIMILTSHEMQLFIWQNKTLTYRASFTNSPDSLNLLSQTIIKSRALPVIIITNFIEESFLNETVAHVLGNDRKALLERKLAYVFRTSPYRVAKVIEREKEGRRDDRILLSALTKPDLLKPWVKILLDQEIPIQSITSAAYLGEGFAQSTLAGKEDQLLLVSLEKNSELRQTYLKKGQILFSRLTSLPSNEATTLADSIYKESLQIRSYLERIKMLPYDEKLTIQIYSPFDDSEIKIKEKSNRINTFESFNINEEISNLSIELNNSPPNAISLFLAQILQKKKVVNTYAPFNVRRYFHLNTISRALIWSSSALILAFVLFKVPTLTGAMDNWNQQTQVISNTIPLNAEYNVLSQRFPETPIPSEEMALVVKTHESIAQQSYILDEALSIISQALTTAPELKLTAINWEVIEQAQEVIDDGFGFGPISNAGGKNAFQKAVLENRTTVKVLIDGLSFSPRSYRAAQDQVLTFSDALAAHPNISVELLKMPTDVRLDTSVQATVNGDELRARFTLELTFESSLEEPQ